MEDEIAKGAKLFDQFGKIDIVPSSNEARSLPRSKNFKFGTDRAVLYCLVKTGEKVCLDLIDKIVDTPQSIGKEQRIMGF